MPNVVEFRVWLPDRKQMLYDEFFIRANGDVYISDNECDTDIYQKNAVLMLKVWPQIYQDDIICICGNLIVRVDYINRSFCLSAPGTGWPRQISFSLKHAIILGNIYENPDILKKEKLIIAAKEKQEEIKRKLEDIWIWYGS